MLRQIIKLTLSQMPAVVKINQFAGFVLRFITEGNFCNGSKTDSGMYNKLQEGNIE